MAGPGETEEVAEARDKYPHDGSDDGTDAVPEMPELWGHVSDVEQAQFCEVNPQPGAVDQARVDASRLLEAAGMHAALHIPNSRTVVMYITPSLVRALREGKPDGIAEAVATAVFRDHHDANFIEASCWHQG